MAITRISGKTICVAVASGLALFAPLRATANCWHDAAATYNIPVAVLAAVAKQESGFNPIAIHINNDQTRDIGLMQISDRHLPELGKYGISEADLFDACTNLQVGAWLLAQNAARLGWNWNAIGAYNVGCKKLSQQECDRRRASYAWKIHAALQRVAPNAIVGTGAPRAVVVGGEIPVAETRRMVLPVRDAGGGIPQWQSRVASVSANPPAIRQIVFAKLDGDDDGSESQGDWYTNSLVTANE